MEFFKLEKKRIHTAYIRIAIEEALKSGLTNKHGAVIVKRNKVILRKTTHQLFICHDARQS